MSKKKSQLKLAVTLLAVGGALALVLGVLVRSSKTYIDVEHFGQIVCTSIGAMSTTSTEYGFPFTFLTRFENGCTGTSYQWQPVNLIGNVAFFGLLASGVLYLRRRIIK
jgi:hypothetical protein